MVGYIGKQPQVGAYIKLDSITTSATTTFNLLNGGVAYSPESARVCLVSLNGVIQNPETAFNIVGSTIVFSQALTSDDVIDYILILGDTLSVGVPSDGSISTVKLSDNAVTTAKINNDAVTVDKLNLVSTGSTPSLEAKGTSGVTEGYIQLNCAENSHGIKLKSPPHSAGANYTLTFPNNDGSADEFLKTNGSGVLSWGSASAVEYKVATNNTTSSATYTGSQSSYTDHITQSITLTQVCTVICQADFQHSYESGDVNMAGRFTLTPSSGSDINGATQQIACYGFGSNRAMGSHNMFTAFQDVSAGTYTVKLQMRNDGGSGSQGILNYFAGSGGTAGDRIYILYK